ncbi:DNA primase [Gammaproteobacteria bacterium]|nr:DNA primase [Gammaproteobacteria bacterium]
MKYSRTMEMIPREFIQQLINKTDIVDLIDGKIPLQKKSSNNYFSCCPFHTEKSASFSVSQNKQFYYCFGCGANGNAIDFLIKYDRLSFPEAVEMLAKIAGIEIPRKQPSVNKKMPYPDIYDLLNVVTNYYRSELKNSNESINYLKNRGLSGVIAKKFSIGYAPPGWGSVLHKFGTSQILKEKLFDAGMLIKKADSGFYDRFRDRIIFPIQDRRGRVIGFGGRVTSNDEPKYLNSPETTVFQKGHELYGLYQSLQDNNQLKRVLIVEGYMDVIALFQNDITYSVATLGTATSSGHLQRLFKLTSEIVFCFDGDEAGRVAAWRALLVSFPVMRDDVHIKFMFLPDGEDPDSLVRKEGKENFELRIDKATNLSTFFFQHIASLADISSTDGRAKFAKLALEHLKKLPESIFKQMMYDDLSVRARTKIDKISSSSVDSKVSSGRKANEGPPSTMRQIITLLTQNPYLAKLIIDPLPKLELRGYDFFEKIMGCIKANNIQTTGELIEFWRDKPERKLLLKFAEIELMIPSIGIDEEFLGSIDRMKQISNKQIVENYLAKAAKDGLTLNEKKYLRNLIQDKQ